MEKAKEEIIKEILKGFDTGKFSDYLLDLVEELMFEAITQARKGYVKEEELRKMYDIKDGHIKALKEQHEKAIAVNRSEVFDEMNKHMNEVIKGMVKIEDVEKILKKLSWTQNGKGEFFCMKKEHKTTCATCVQETLIKKTKDYK